MNNKGFMMAEVVVVASIVLVTLVGLYTSYNKIFSIYNKRVDYYDVATLYDLAYIRDGIDFSVTNPSISNAIYNNVGDKVYYINKYDIVNLNVSNQTFKDYLDFLDGSLDIENLKVDDKNVTNILIMENCDSDGMTNCTYAYLEVPDETE